MAHAETDKRPHRTSLFVRDNASTLVLMEPFCFSLYQNSATDARSELDTDQEEMSAHDVSTKRSTTGKHSMPTQPIDNKLPQEPSQDAAAGIGVALPDPSDVASDSDESM
jgi:hypothetical protein